MVTQVTYQKNKCKYDAFINAYAKRHTDRFGTPLIMTILVTNKCNLRCKHCFYHQTIDKTNCDLTIDEYEKISRSMGWFMTAIFSGGEPFLREDFSDIVRIFQTNNKLAMVDSASNGQLQDSIITQTEKILKNRYQDYSLGISLEGFRELNDFIRGEGAFDKAVSTWKELKKLQSKHSNFHPYICTTINSANQSEMRAFLEWIDINLEPEKISLLKIRQNPRAGEHMKQVSIDNYRSCVEYIQSLTEQGKMGDVNKPQTYMLPSCYECILQTMETNKRAFDCFAGIHGGFLDHNGNVGVCEVLPPLGNIKEYDYDFSQIWNSQAASIYRGCVGKDSACKLCTHESEGILPSLNFGANTMKEPVNIV